MKPSELFGVIVRTIGFLVIIYGVYEIFSGFENTVENFLPSNQGDEASQYSSFSYFAFGIPGFLFGLLCFFLADWIVKLAYRHPET